MAEPSAIPTAAPAPAPAAGAAVLEWAGPDGPCYLGNSTSSPVAFVAKFNPTSNTALLRLGFRLQHRDRVPSRKSDVFLYIRPDADVLRSVMLRTCGTFPEESKQLGRDLICLQFSLAGTADFVASSWPIIPRNKFHKDALGSILLFAQQTEFSLYAEKSFMPEARLELFCQTLSSHKLTADDMSKELYGLYGGEAGEVVSPELLISGDASTESPPSYAQTEAPPPIALLEPGTASGSKKRRRASSIAEGPALAEGPASLDIDLIQRVCSKLVSEQLAGMEARMKAWVNDRLADGEKRCDDELERLGNDLERLGNDLEAVDSRLDDRVWVEVDELKTTIHEDFEDLRNELEAFVRDETSAVADSVLKELGDAEVNIVGGKLEIV